MFIVIAGQKGGSGKTTIAINFAVIKALSNTEVLLLDTDSQASASLWCELRNQRIVDEELDLKKINCLQKSGKYVREELLSLREKFADFIVDTPGHDSNETRSALLVADVAILPFKAAQFDLWTLSTMNQLIDDVKLINPKLTAYVCINQASTNMSNRDEIDQARDYFANADFQNLTLAQSIVYERKVFRTSAAQGMSVLESEPKDTKAITEIKNLISEVCNG
jgi:chromosome partitioning protein